MLVCDITEKKRLLLSYVNIKSFLPHKPIPTYVRKDWWCLKNAYLRFLHHLFKIKVGYKISRVYITANYVYFKSEIPINNSPRSDWFDLTWSDIK